MQTPKPGMRVYVITATESGKTSVEHVASTELSAKQYTREMRQYARHHKLDREYRITSIVIDSSSAWADIIEA